jgi:hypothetical protein
VSFKNWIYLFWISLSTFIIASRASAEPDFMIIGVTKCGTSFLYANLVQHAQILGAATKELHYFDEKYKRGWEWYMGQFPVKSTPDELIGEASPGYFWKKGCLKRIARDCPNTKFILILRNPEKRAISSYFYFKIMEPHTTGVDFLSTVYRTGDRDHLYTNYERHITAGFYSSHLKRWLRIFPREQFHILFLEDLITDAQAEFNKIFIFLGLPEQEIVIVDRKHKTAYDVSEIHPTILEWLKDIYRPYNKELEELLGHPLPWNIGL